MNTSLTAHFDGKVIIPDEAVELPIGKKLKISVEVVEETLGAFADLLEFTVNEPDGPTDLAEQHDHYLYGHPKK